jgi:thymidylate synthase
MEEKEGSKVIFYEDSRGSYVLDKPMPGVNPAISVYADTVPAAWELAMIACWEYGARVATHYDPTSDTPKSKEGTIIVRVSNPFNEPRLCKNIPGGPEELEVYRQEVVNGIHDHWIEPGTKKWTYTYHERLTNYNPSIDLNAKDRGLLLPKGIDQIEKVIDDLKKDITSKGAQATTWMPTGDPGLGGNRPCLQRLWFRPLLIDEKDESKGYLLNMNSHWRSRDLAKAWFMNVYAITDWQRDIAQRLEKRIGKPVKVGSYTDISDSLHIYGDYFEEYKLDFDERMKNPNMEKRVWNSDHPPFQLMTEQTKQQLLEDVDYQKKTRKV